jgi:hypothetical protein
MKTYFFLPVIAAFLCSAIGAQGAPSSKTLPDSIPESSRIYVLDGENTAFAWGRQIAPDKIAIGLTDEGVFELRGDTAIWLVEHPGRPDEQICSIGADILSENKLFLFGIFNEHERMIHDTIGMIDPDSFLIFDKAGEPTATIKSDDKNGTIDSMNGITYLHVKATTNRKLAAFFLLYHYLPQKKTIKQNTSLL